MLAFTKDIVFTVAFALFGAYIGWRALKGDKNSSWVRSFAIAFAAMGGTSFRGADLTDADFTSATLKNTDFRGAILTRTYFHQARMLDRVRPGQTYLRNPQICQLLVTGNGHDKNFDFFDLRGVNLYRASLENTSFIGANLSEASLQDANLQGAKLKQTQLDRTDFTGVNLTGAYIENWGITSETKLDRIECEYIFMRLPGEGSLDRNPHRKPEDWEKVFEEGEFVDFIAPIIKTLDLYHNKQVNLRAIQIAFNKLAEQHPEAELFPVAIERRGKNNEALLLKLKTAEDANQVELSAEYFENYNHYKNFSSEALISLLAEKDKTILMLVGQIETAMKTAIEKHSINAQTFQNQGETLSSKLDNSNNSIYNLDNSKFGGGFAGTGGNQTGGIFNDNYSNPSLAQTVTEIQKILNKLELINFNLNEIEKNVITAKIAKEINKNSILKAQIATVIKSGGKESLIKELNHPIANILISILEEELEV